MEHCATRLRLILKDKELIDEDAIENIEGVKGQFFCYRSVSNYFRNWICK